MGNESVKTVIGFSLSVNIRCPERCLVEADQEQAKLRNIWTSRLTTVRAQAVTSELVMMRVNVKISSFNGVGGFRAD